MKESDLVRFGVSMPQELIERFDSFITEQGYNNRSEAIRDLVRKALIQPERLSPKEPVAGTVVIVYDHHATDLPNYLMELQHEYHGNIISTMHVHLNHHQCLEIIIVNGEYGSLQSLTDAIRVQKGVFYAELSVSVIKSQSPGRDGDDHHDHDHHSHHNHHNHHNHHQQNHV
ncbi:nickel-responsive transcriptional regulator NikR [Paenibacillus abyssi]|uniref:Putative nickel-responsive regulator n=1 Tax=Paenibacillus abyssi TaxID=1340531 RepID=A0A917FR65_9BACL|nr:nickel-responsive transcriptional regulator NikR [Paenibacillus abyssi]GGG01224.1 putative nickel-responsive regulator [Paenibacillus abyssi]